MPTNKPAAECSACSARFSPTALRCPRCGEPAAAQTEAPRRALADLLYVEDWGGPQGRVACLRRGSDRRDVLGSGATEAEALDRAIAFVRADRSTREYLQAIGVEVG